MNVLWITNIGMPPICEAMGLPVPAIGGWMYSSLRRVKELGDIRFAVATTWHGNHAVEKSIDGVTYHMLPLKGHSNNVYNSSLEEEWRRIRDSFRPDVVHVHGSEFPLGLAYVRACGSAGVAVSIQGMLSVYARYYCAGITEKEVRVNMTLRDMLRGTILHDRREMARRGVYETDLLQSVNHIIGRTQWDCDNTRAVNPEAAYHFCNETLRESFYTGRWSPDSCRRHRIFVSQAIYPIKGLHKLLQAMPLILREYPDTQILVGGTDIVHRPWYRLTGYGRYLQRLIEANGLDGKVEFAGMLDEQRMKEAYLSANVFVCPSSIENSPNSVGEAQLLGVPTVAAYAGGMADMIPAPGCGEMYRFEETAMLAGAVCRAFGNSESFDNTEMRQTAALRHNPDMNARTLARIYNEIVMR